MPRPALELADIFRQHGPAYRQAHDLPWHQQRLMQAIESCRTPALGGVVELCGHCQYTHIQYRSCRNRHCPKCQGAARQRWLEAVPDQDTTHRPGDEPRAQLISRYRSLTVAAHMRSPSRER